MKFKATEGIKLRLGPSVESPQIGSIPLGAVVESDEYAWKAVTLSDGKKGFCAAKYLEAVSESSGSKWFSPIRIDKFKITQKFLAPDSNNYPKTGVHPGVDYGTQGEDNVPLYFCADGQVIESGSNSIFGNYFFYYVAEADRTFVYFHLKNAPPVKMKYKAGEQCGTAGKTGFSQGIHLHLECIKGKKTSADRASLFSSKASLELVAEDADAFVRSKL